MPLSTSTCCVKTPSRSPGRDVHKTFSSFSNRAETGNADCSSSRRSKLPLLLLMLFETGNYFCMRMIQSFMVNPIIYPENTVMTEGQSPRSQHSPNNRRSMMRHKNAITIFFSRHQNDRKGCMCRTQEHRYQGQEPQHRKKGSSRHREPITIQQCLLSRRSPLCAPDSTGTCTVATATLVVLLVFMVLYL